MANRIIRDWTDSEKIDRLSNGAEVFFTRLFMKADDFGSFHANPSLIIGALFPLRIKSVKQRHINRWLYECEVAGLIFLYESKGKKYLRIINFGQRLRNMRNTFPKPTDDDLRRLAATCGEKPLETKRNETEEETETKSNARQELLFTWFEKILLDQLLCETFCKISVSEPEDFFIAVEYFFTKNKAIETWYDYKDFSKHFINWSPNWKSIKSKHHELRKSTFKDATGFSPENPFLKEHIENLRSENVAN